MWNLNVLIALSLVSICMGAGGHGGSGSSAGVVSTNDAVKILQVPRPLSFYCNDTRPDGTKVKFDWYKAEDSLGSDARITARQDGTLTIDPTVAEDIGTYSCHAREIEYSVSFDVVIIEFRKLPKSTTAIEGDQMTLTCDVTGTPPPKVSWTKDNVSIEEAIGDRLEFTTGENLPENSTIIVRNVTRSDRGYYNCTFSNHEGLVLSTNTLVRVKDIYAALWPFLGIVAEVTVLCLIIFIYEKRRTKHDFEESDTDQGPH